MVGRPRRTRPRLDSSGSHDFKKLGKKSLSLWNLPSTIEVKSDSDEIGRMVQEMVDRRGGSSRRGVGRSGTPGLKPAPPLRRLPPMTDVAGDADEIDGLVDRLIDKRKKTAGEEKGRQVLRRTDSGPSGSRMTGPRTSKATVVVERVEIGRYLKRAIPVLFALLFPLLYLVVFLRVVLELPVGEVFPLTVGSTHLFLSLAGLLLLTVVVNAVNRVLIKRSYQNGNGKEVAGT